ncbi:hypothetical protein CLV30_1123 [Haloactinopolyspora alba]|uniref:Spermine/spermidine synthase n=1 Tax=Haloactinopolyspora alba TaxID=648780 RepID=A0A2P8DX32_9ACTN|nr:hypothetical protein [Haloactinopolyspora alba]PSL01764.1 hypothetical protein CLV30_1123 [Haloactinopolyspora alba]
MLDGLETVERVDGVGGEVVVRRRAGTDGADVYELIVNGTFLMDTAETSTERLLATTFLDRHDAPGRVLVGGLGFGFTVQELLADARVRRVDVIEMEPALVRLLRAGTVPGADVVVRDPRVHVSVDDIRSVMRAGTAESYDGILLDVDNGPDFLVHEANDEVYRPPLLRAAAHRLRPGGMLAVWSSAPSARLSSDLTDVVGDVEELVRTVRREGRHVDYHVYVASRPH